MAKSSTNQVTTSAPTLAVDKLDEPIPIARIIELRNKGLTYEEIASILGCTKQNIHIRLQPYRHAIDNLKSIKENEADTYTVVKHTILNSLTGDDIKKSTGYQKVGMFALVDERERIKRTGMTDIVGYVDMNDTLYKVIRERERLQDELGIDADTADMGDVSD